MPNIQCCSPCATAAQGTAKGALHSYKARLMRLGPTASLSVLRGSPYGGRHLYRKRLKIAIYAHFSRPTQRIRRGALPRSHARSFRNTVFNKTTLGQREVDGCTRSCFSSQNTPTARMMRFDLDCLCVVEAWAAGRRQTWYPYKLIAGARHASAQPVVTVDTIGSLLAA